MADRRDDLASLILAAKGKFGQVIGQAGKLALTVPRIETGSLMLDYAFGGSMINGRLVAGVPVGRVTMFWGEKSSGKSTNSLRIVSQAQKRCRNCWRPAKNLLVKELDEDPETGEVKVQVTGECDCVKSGLFEPPRMMVEYQKNQKTAERDETDKEYNARLDRLKENSYEEAICAWADIEGAYDDPWATALGIDGRRLVYMRPETAEEGIDLLDPLLRSGTVDLLVLDSIAQMTPSAEVQESSMDWQRGLAARLTNKMVRKMVSAVSRCARLYRRAPTQLWINQVRATMNQYGPSTIVPGGKGQGFATHVEFECWSKKPEVDQMDAGNKDEKIDIPKRQELHFKCVKNKTAPPNKSGFYTQILHETYGKLGSIDEKEQVIRYAKHFEAIKKDGAKYVLMGKKYDKMGEIEALLDDPIAYGELRTYILKVLLTGDA